MFSKQTLRELSSQTGLSKLTLKTNFEKLTLPHKKHHPRSVHVLADTTFFGSRINGKQWGVILFRDALSGEDLWWRFVEAERLSDYQLGLEQLTQLGYTVTSITCDGLRGLTQLLSHKIPVQLCQFHQKQTVRRYITQNPKLKAGKELKELVSMLDRLSYQEFRNYLQAYINYYRQFLNERTYDPVTQQTHFTHQRLRSAIRSLVTNLEYLFTYEQYPQLNISPTNNAIESHFSHIKTLVRVHRGLKVEMQQKLVTTILLNSSIVKEIP